MRRWGVGQILLHLAIGLLAWAALAALSLMVGSTGDFGWPAQAVLRLRWERVALASEIGAALAAAGVVYQAVLRNPLADPYLLGVSSGATLCAYLWRLPFVATLVALPGLGRWAIGEQAFVFLGAMIAMAVVLAMASERGRLHPLAVVLVGVIVNAVCGSVFLFLNAMLKDPAASGGPLSLLVGGLQSNLSSQQKYTAGACIGVGWIVLLCISGQLNVATLSEAEAMSLGVRIHRLRWIALTTASLMTAAAVAVSGPIGFVGLICPHLVRLLVGVDQRRVLLLATALGAGLLCAADAATRWLSQSRVGQVLPVGVLTGLLGGPFFLLIFWRSRRRVAGGSL